MGDRHANVFLDTSTIIHGPALEQADWLDLLDADTVLLLVPINVVRELDRIKDGSEGRMQRKRARSFFSKHTRFDVVPPSDGIPIRNGVRLQFLHADARMSDHPTLDPAVVDDRIIAEALAFGARPGRKVVLSADNGLLLKARAAGLSPMRMPADLERAPEPDEVERKLAEATRELAELKNRLPDVRVLLFSPRAELRGVNPVHIALRIRTPPPEADRARALEAEARRIEQLQPASFILRDALARHSREDIRQHLEDYRTFLETLTNTECLLSRSFRLGVDLSNEGNAPASQVYLQFDFPKGFEVLELEDEPVLPEPPKLATVLQRISSDHLASRRYENSPELARDPDDPEAHGTMVWYRIRDLMHHTPRPLGDFAVVVPEAWDGRGFEVGVTIQTAEHRQPNETKLQVVTTVERKALALQELLARLEADEQS